MFMGTILHREGQILAAELYLANFARNTYTHTATMIGIGSETRVVIVRHKRNEKVSAERYWPRRHRPR
jgi:hypothetical protein